VRGKKEVRYVVCQAKNPDDLEGERVSLGWHPFLELAKSHADRTGPGTYVDAEGGTLYMDGSHGRHTLWEVEWTNRNLYEGRKKRVRPSEGPVPDPGNQAVGVAP
jgi:hypothetical protein